MPTIDTGYESQIGTDSDPRIRGWAHEALFHAESPTDQNYSRRVSIPEGKVFLFRGFNFPLNRNIYVNTVSVGSTGRPDEPFTDATQDFYLSRMTMGGAENWVMDADHAQMLISLPGIYRFELEDLDMINGFFRLEYYAWNWKTPPVFPVFR